MPLKPRGMVKYKILRLFLQRSKSQLLFCCFVEAKFLAWNLFKLASYGKFGFSRLDLDGNKLAKGRCLASKMRDKEVFV